MSAKDYKVTFGYLAKTTINNEPYTHRGTDRKCPTGTPIVIGGTTIGKTGNTGLTTGPHLHLQAGTDIGCQNTVNPEPYAFKGGKVVALRTTDQAQWGKFITIQVGSKYITYAHLSQINVKVGQVIKEEEMITKQGLAVIYRFRRGAAPNKHAQTHLGKRTFDETDKLVLEASYAQTLRDKAKAGKLNAVNHLPADLRKVYVEPSAKKVKELGAALKIKEAEIARLKAENSVVSEDTELLNGFGSLLVKLLARLGVKK